MAEVKWIKIITNFFSDEKIMLIEQMPEGDTIIVIWVKLLCMAGRENNCGVFVMGGKIPYTDEMLATIFRRNITVVRLALQTFEAFGMIEIIENENGQAIYTIPNWEKHQNTEGLEKIREQTRRRVAKHRENQKLALDCSVTSNVTVTQCNATEEEKNKNKKENKKKNKNITAPYVADDDLNSAILSFVEFRNKIKKPMTERAIQLLITKLNKLSPDINTQIEIINQSILNGWQGIFPLNNTNKTTTRQEAVPRWMQNRGMQRDNDFEATERALLANNTAEAAAFSELRQAAEKRIKEVCAQ